MTGFLWLQLDAGLRILIIIMFLLLPSQYAENSCELIAKDFQEKHSGSMFFIQPLTSSGAYEFGDRTGHWINGITIHSKKYFIDYGNQRIFQNREEVKKWYRDVTGKESQSFEIGTDNVPFGIIYHY